MAEVSDGSLTIIGGDCGADKFDADSTIGRDIHRANVTLDQQDKLARLAELLTKRDSAFNELGATKARLIDLRKAVAAYRDKLGRVAWNALTNMCRTGNTAIQVVGFTPEVRNDKDEVVRDRRSIVINIASLAGITVCNEAMISASLDGLRRIEAAYKRAGEQPNVNLKPKEVKSLNAALADQSREVTRALELVDQLSRFETNDFTALAFIVTDISERIHLMQFGLEKQGKPSSKNAAKKILLERETALKLQHRVKHIRAQ